MTPACGVPTRGLLAAALALSLAPGLLGCSSASARNTAAPQAGPADVFAARDLPLEQVLARASAGGRPALLLFVARWCGYCRQLEQGTLADAGVRAHLAGFEVVRYDADGPTGRDLARRYGVQGFPTWVRVDASGAAVARYVGYDAPADLVARITRP
ncbi:MAG: thioredoxin family protein [Planctomycetia bacterium]